MHCFFTRILRFCLPSPATRDAWVLLIVAAELYILGSIVLTGDSILGGTALVQVLCLALPAILYAKWKTGAVKEGLRLRPVSGAIWLRVTLLALTGIGASFLLDQATFPLLARYFADWIPMLEALAKLFTPKTTEDWVVNLLVIGLVAPVCEELLFRGAFQGTLEQRGPGAAIACTALAFGVIHFNPFNFIGPILFGLGIGVVVWRTGSILPAILWHALNNSGAVLIMGWGGSDFVPPWWVNAALTILFGLLLWEFIRHTRQVAPSLSPLASAPPATRIRFYRAIPLAGATCAILLLAGLSCLSKLTHKDDGLLPDYAAEDVCFYTRDLLRPLIRVRTNDVVLWKDAKTQRTHYGRVVKLEGDQMTLGIKPREGATFEIPIKRSEVIGKFVGKITLGEELKLLRSQIQSPQIQAQ